MPHKYKKKSSFSINKIYLRTFYILLGEKFIQKFQFPKRILFSKEKFNIDLTSEQLVNIQN